MQKKAEVLIEALPYISEFKGMTIIIKIGNLTKKNIRETFVQDLSLMLAVGFKPIVILESNKNCIEKELMLEGVKSVTITGKDSGTFQFDNTGSSIISVETTLLKTLIENKFIPVVSPVGFNIKGEKFNISGNEVATEIARWLKVEKLIFLTEFDGIFENKKLLSKVKIGRLKEMIKRGTVDKNMEPLLKVYIEGINKGIDDIHILNQNIEHSLILEIFTDKGIGTLIEG